MLKSYFTIAVRHLIRDRLHSFIMISGLVVGMTCAILTGMFIRHELSYDRFHADADRIYRVTLERLNPDGSLMVHTGRVGFPVFELLRSEFPELSISTFHVEKNVLKTQDQSSFQWLFYVDPNFLRLFSFPLLKGDIDKALTSPNTIVLTERVAKIYFGNQDPLGKTVVWYKQDFTVTGVLADPPLTSHMNFDVLASLATLTAGKEKTGGFFTAWYTSKHAVYLRLPDGYPADRLLSQLPAFVARHTDPSLYRLNLQALTDIYLHPLRMSSLFSESERQGDARTLWVYGSIGLLILVIACVNFINLSTARFGNRVPEIGMRKVSGAGRTSLIGQFLGESTLLALTALPIAYLIAELTLPAFAMLVGSTAGRHIGPDGWTLLGLFTITITVGLISGIYPAVFLSRINTGVALRGRQATDTSRSTFRNALVILQFASAMILIISALVIRDQLTYFRTRDLGFDKEHVLLVKGHWFSNFRYEGVKERFLQHPNVLGVTISAEAPSIGGGLGWVMPVRVGYKAVEVELTVGVAEVRDGFLETYGIELLAGRDFSPDIASDATAATIVNRTALESLGFIGPDDAIGKPLEREGKTTTIIGVVDDFHFGSLHEHILPVFLEYLPDPGVFHTFLAVRLGTDDVPQTLAFLEQGFRELMDNRPFTYSFLDEAFERLYRNEIRQGNTFSVFSGIAVFLSCWGLLGLIAFAVERRRKEIGIRKVCGATVSSVLTLLSSDYLRLAALANLFAWPVAYHVMQAWLGNFAYHIELGPIVFVLGSIIALTVLVATVSYQVIKAATSNPIDALRHE